MATLYLTEQYSLVRRDGETLVVQIPKNKKTGTAARKVRLPLHKIERVVVQGEVTLTGSVMRLLLKMKIPVAFCSYYGRFEGMLLSADSKNGLLRQAQHDANRDVVMRTRIARLIVLGKLHNQKVFLQRSNRKPKEEQVAVAIKRIGKAMKAVQEADFADEFSSTQAWLMGQEGIAAKNYFQALQLLLHDPMGFSRRIRRPPTDPINAMLGYGYTILTSAATSALQIIGFDAHTGYLHSPEYGRPALALDLIEEFRTPIVDSVILRLVNTRAIKQSDFKEEGTAIHLTDRGKRIFLQAFEKRMKQEIMHPIFEQKTSYRRCLELQARILVRCIQGEIARYIPFRAR